MSEQLPTRRQWFAILGVIGLGAASLAGLSIANRSRYAAAEPPADMKTIDDFLNWKQASIHGRGTCKAGGTTYTVVFATAGRYLESGPAAYLFDEQGRFVDWTDDMGDHPTENRGFWIRTINRK